MSLESNRNLIATYGSLKREKYNHGVCGDQVYVGDMTVRGYMTLVHGAYPQLYLDDSGPEHNVEVFVVDDLTLEQIEIMELGAGYTPINISTPWGEARMWVFISLESMSGVPIESYDDVTIQ